ncbi:MAG: glycosyltransferase family 2 protein [Lachnospiraceae bacterium]|nr:glycosyltransferase family 2 protein [Lachnospiraceae bacterium]
MSKNILLSICIPTNGIVEWVLPVLESIYRQNGDNEEIEVIVTDNGNNCEFEKTMRDYLEQHRNLVYQKTGAKQFLNQIEAFKLARGEFIKFLNHRMTMREGALVYLLDFVKKHLDTKPICYFLNGMDANLQEENNYGSFDKYVGALSYWSSWSAGTAMWREDFIKMQFDKPFNELFPHTDIVFCEKSRSEYIIVNKMLFEELPIQNIKKGTYNLFYAFAVEYISIILELFCEKYIGIETFLKIKKENAYFVAQQFWAYIIRKKDCSYDLSDYDKYLKVYYKKSDIYINIGIFLVKKYLIHLN